jgi:P27 family predicted phage terminase small subunit
MGGRGSGGNNRRPNHLKVLEGAEEARINRHEPIPAAVDSLAPPVKLSDSEQAVWDRLVPDLVAKKVMTAWDSDAFVSVCRAVALREECWRRMHDPADPDYGLTAQGSAGGVIPNPLFRILARCNDDLARFGSRFGLTPADRAALKIEPDEGPSAGAERLLS